MSEAIVRIKFLAPCLGQVKSPSTQFLFLRDPSGHIVFMPTWHRANMWRASKALSRWHREATSIRWNPRIWYEPGDLDWYQRYMDHKRFALHEAFLPGTEICIGCLLPPRLSCDDLAQLWAIAGKYCGLSPFRHGEYGTFEVVDVSLGVLDPVACS